MKTIQYLAVIMNGRGIRPLNYAAVLFGMDFSRQRGCSFLVYRFMIFLVFILFFVHEIPTMRFWVINLSSLHSMLALIEVMLHWAALFLICVLNWKHNQYLNKALDELGFLRLQLSEKRVKTLAWAQSIHFVGFGIFCVVYNALGHLIIWENEFFDWHTFIIYTVSDFFIGFTSILFSQMVFMLFLYFQELNEILSRLKEVFQPTGFGYFALGSWKTLSGHVAHVRNTHLKLCVISQSVNNCFSAQLLLSVLLDMVEIIYSLRSLVFYIARSDDSGVWSTNPCLEMTLTFFWCCLFLGSLIAIIAVCDLTVSESHRTQLLTHELINVNFSKSSQRELLIFSQQLNHHTAHFSAGRLLNLRFSLIRSIIGATITYLVIIVTFKN